MTFAPEEELGPGDVQYLRGNSMAQLDSTTDGVYPPSWLGTSNNPDSLLQQAEKHLAEVITDSGLEPKSTKSHLPEISANTVPSTNRSARSRGLTLEDLGELDLDITIELGRTEILIEDILKLREGSVVSLDKLAGDPVDIVANGRLVARGELLVIDGKFGVRLSEVL